MIDSCPVEIDKVAVVATPAVNNLIHRGESKILKDTENGAFHKCVTKEIFRGKIS